MGDMTTNIMIHIETFLQSNNGRKDTFPLSFNHELSNTFDMILEAGHVTEIMFQGCHAVYVMGIDAPFLSVVPRRMRQPGHLPCRWAATAREP